MAAAHARVVVSKGRPQVDRAELQLQAAGLTLLGVTLSIGVTVGMGLSGAWWYRVAAGSIVCVALAVFVGLGARHTAVLRRVARWITGQ